MAGSNERHYVYPSRASKLVFLLNRKKGINLKILMKTSCSVKLNSVSSGKKPKLKKKKSIKVRAWVKG